MKNLKDQKGITLVALVITIIVLLILAGVSLSLVVGDNGILGRASNTAKEQREAEVREKVVMELVNLESEFYQYKYSSNPADVSKADTATAKEYAIKNFVPSDIKGTTVTFKSGATHDENEMTISFSNGVETVNYKVTADENNFNFAKQS